MMEARSPSNHQGHSKSQSDCTVGTQYPTQDSKSQHWNYHKASGGGGHRLRQIPTCHKREIEFRKRGGQYENWISRRPSQDLE
ncbi:hypothetical protein PAMP_021351 [Pampus punctatissimus]